MSTGKRKLQYSLAINEALHQLMEVDPTVILIGQGVKSPWYVGNTANRLLERFGPARVIDTPVSENATTGAAAGAAMAGLRPVVVHPRMDFMLYAFDPIVNQAANWHFMSGGRLNVPLVVWGIVNRGGEQAAQHSQALHALFAHIPGLKVVMPSTPYDAKGLMIAAVRDPNPVVFIDDRWLYREEGEVPQAMYTVPIGEAAIRLEGRDVTIVSISSMMPLVLESAVELRTQGISAEVIDLRTIKPWDQTLVLDSVRKTSRLIVVDPGWRTCGYAAEVSAVVSEVLFGRMAAPVRRVTLPDAPAPASRSLEQAYYPTSDDIVRSVFELLNKERKPLGVLHAL